MTGNSTLVIAAPASVGSENARRLGLGGATVTNMLAMIGVGPFITIPLLLQAIPGPQAMLGWVLGGIVALADGLVWAELGAGYPRSGGGYHYLLEAYGPRGPGRLMSFLFLWATVITGPLVMASGAIGFSQYATYLVPAMSPGLSKLLAMSVCLTAAAMIYRRIDRIGQWAIGLSVVVILAMAWIIVEGFRHAHAQNLVIPRKALDMSPALWSGMGGATLYALYDYFGYATVCSVGGEVARPERTIPRAIVVAIMVVAALYLAMNIAVISALPWREAARSKFVASDLMARLDGPVAGVLITVLILVTTLAGVFAGMLSLSRVPFAAAADNRFFRIFAQTHPTGGFPTFAVAYVGVASAVCCLLDLDQLIKALTVAGVILSSLAVVAAPTLLRLRYPEAPRPFRMWLYPAPSLIAAAGWSYIVITSGAPYILGGFGALALGVLAYLWRAWPAREWPWRGPEPQT